MQKKVFCLLKAVYKKLPINYKTKNKLKGIFYRIFGFLFRNTTSYRVWNSINYKEKVQTTVSVSQEEAEKYNCDKKIAIHLHLYYTDLLEEFKKYFNNIPFTFDILVSVTDKDVVSYVKTQLEQVSRVNLVFVEVVNNRGRDVAPFVVTFGSRILNYDYICHVHSKKSLFTGGEQSEWRKYLLDGLMGSVSTVKRNLYLLEKGEKVGLLYPETFSKMPYIAHTWLRNKASRDELLERINVLVKNSDIYIDYPLGTMFWARVDAIRQFFEARIKLEEFQKEEGQTDGTIAHAFERCLSLVCKYNGYNLLVFDLEDNTYSYNYGRKNLNQYTMKNYEAMKAELAGYDVVSFDIFDTLISRRISEPEFILDLTELKLNHRFGEKSDFKRKRLQAESQIRNKFPDNDCNIHQIYDELGKITKWKDDKLEFAKKTEITIEIQISAPKKEVIKVLEDVAVRSKKEVHLISDMHLGKTEITEILEKNGVYDYQNLYLSSEQNKRKDNGSMWKFYSRLYENKELIHIGDNETSDAQIPGDYGIKNFHLMSNKALFQLSNMGKAIGNIEPKKASDSVELGLILDRLFSDPLRYNQNHFEVTLKSASEFGYSFMGPVVLNYILWLIQKAKEQSASVIFFCAREGYILKQIYEIISSHLYKWKVQGKYLYVSRRALSVAAIEEEKDIEGPLDIFYEGKLKGLIKSRFGLNLDDIPDEDIKLPDNKSRVFKLLQPYRQQIIKNAEKERKNYLEYFSRQMKECPGKTMILSDIGYSGTIQYYLSKISGYTFDGCYFATDNRKKPLLLSGNSIEGYYIDNDAEQQISKSNIHKYHLLLESILIAPDGQLVYIDEKCQPVFDENSNPLYSEVIQEIHKGIAAYANDYADIMQEVMLDELPDKELPERLIQAVVKEDILDKGIADSIKIDDKYCSGKILNAIDYYKKGIKK